MIGDLILWQKRVWKQMFCVHDYHWRNLTDDERDIPHYRDIYGRLVCKKCGRGEVK